MFGRFFETFQASDVHPLLSAGITVNELSKWPLVHGSMQLGYDEKRAEMQADGLRSSVENINSVDTDRLLGRTEYVFIALATFRMNYGFGAGLLIDPAVLTTTGTICSEEDVTPAIECLTMALSGRGKSYCGSAADSQHLLKMADAFVSMNGRNAPDALGKFLLTDGFKEHYATHHHLTIGELLGRVERSAGHKTLFELFNRTGLWRDPEIMIPQTIPSQYLLGYFNGNQFEKWNDPQSPDVQVRLDAWVETKVAIQNRGYIAAAPKQS